MIGNRNRAVTPCELVRPLPLLPDGAVFEARLPDRAEPVLVAKLGDAELVARAERALALDHPAIARSYAVIELADGPALVQAIAPGRMLSQLDDAWREELQPSLVELIDQLLGAFEHAHGRGITHGDLRPDDIVIDGERARVRRFGFARPSRPPSPRYDLVALGAALAPLIADGELRAAVTSPIVDASTLRRLVRDTWSRSGGAEPRLDGDTARDSTPEAFSRTEAHQPSLAPPSTAPPRVRAEPTKLPDLIGRKLGDFVVREKIAEGGLGMVFRAEQASLGRQVVIKVPFSKNGPTERLLRRFIHEAQLASRLDHPYAAHVYAFGNEPDGLMWIAMELVKGTPLDEYLRVCGPMPPARVAALVERLAQVIHRAHELEIVHRDIKPSNVMVLQRSGRLLPKLLDFGIARDASIRANDPSFGLAATAAPEALAPHAPLDKLTMRGAVMGSPLYMAPEQWTDASQVGAAADIYALGVLTYELIVGRPPFTGATLTEVEHAHAKAPVPSLGARLPRALDDVLAKAMAKSADERYATALDFATALEAASGGGNREAAPLPQIEETVRVALLERAPPPLAETLATLDSARNPHQARSALDQVVDAAVNWLGVLALAARSRTGASPSGDSERATAILRELGRRVIEPAEWLALTRELTRPFAAHPELHPLAELVAFVAKESAPLDELLARRHQRRDVSEERVRASLADDVAMLGRLLGAMSFVRDYRVVIARGGRPEAWAGVRRGARPPIALRGDGAVDGEPLLVDGDGVPLLRLHPLVQVAPPMPGNEDALFVLTGSSAAGALLVASPQGFQIASAEVHEWLRAQILVAGFDADEKAGASERPPYRGLSAFTPDDADNFVGRERERESFLNRLRVQSLLAVVGRSGSGKSSFVQAGVIPHLPRGWQAITFRPGAAPMAALQARLNAPSLQAAADAHAAAAGGAAGTLVVVVDQFEELFTLCHDTEARRQFADELATATSPGAAGRIRVILTLRDDFLIPAEELDALRDRLSTGLVLLAAPGAEDLERILVEPARRYGYAFDDAELPRRMVKEVADEPGALAMLSFAAAELWERRDRHFKKLQVQAYDAMGGVTGALVGHAEATLRGMSVGERGLVRELFRRLVTAEGTRALVPKSELVQSLGDAARASSAIEKLVASRLLVASEGVDGQEQVEVAHETLLQAWPRLVEWLREDAEGIRLRDQLRVAAHQWEQRGRPRGLLWRDDALVEYQLWRARRPDVLPASEEAFAGASVAEWVRGRRMRRLLLGSAFVILGVVSAILYGMNRREVRARDEAHRRLVDGYVEQGRTALLGGHHWQALSLLTEALREGADSPPLQLMRGLALAPARAMVYRVAAHDGQIDNVVLSPDDKLILTAAQDGAAIWDAAEGKRPRWLTERGEAVYDAVFSADGSRVATVGADGVARVWDTAGGRLLHALPGNVAARRIVLSPDGRGLATSADDGKVRIWDIGAEKLLATVVGSPPSWALEWGPRFIATAGDDGFARVWDSRTGALVATMAHEKKVVSVRFDKSGDRLVTASWDRTVRIWELPSGKRLHTLYGSGERLEYADFSPDGKEVVGAARDGVARIWDATTGALRLSLRGRRGTLWFAEFDREGRRLLTSGDDGTVRVWDRESGHLIAELEGHTALVRRAHFSGDGRRVVSASADGSLASWDPGDPFLEEQGDGVTESCNDAVHVGGYFAALLPKSTLVWSAGAQGIKRVADLPAAEHATIDAAATWLVTSAGAKTTVRALPSGRQQRVFDAGSPVTAVALAKNVLLAGTADGVAHLWSLDDGRELASFGGHAGGVSAVAFSPDGQSFAVAAGSGAVELRTGGDRRAPAFTFDAPRPPTMLLFSPTSGVLSAATGGDSSLIVLVDVAARRVLASLHGLHAGMLATHFNRAGDRFFATSVDGSAALWEVPSGRLIATYSGEGQYLADATLDASEQVFITADGEGDLVSYEAATGKRLGVIPGNAPPIFVGDVEGAQLGMLSRFGAFSLWRIPFDHQGVDGLTRSLARSPHSQQWPQASPQ
jgi:WD40 repeat protein/serine/threonine protein kinase